MCFLAHQANKLCISNFVVKTIFCHFLQIGLYDVQKHDISNVTTTLNVKFDEASKKPEQNKY